MKNHRLCGWCALAAVVALCIQPACSWAVALKVMPLGDSITDGYNVPGGYRIKLWQDFGSSSANIDFLGSLSNGPTSLGDKNHEGHGGWTIANAPSISRTGIYESLPTFLPSTVNPDVILLMVGTNDINLNYQVSTAPQRLDTLITKITDKTSGLKPNATVIVGSIAPIDVVNNIWGSDANANNRVIAFNAAIPSVVAAHRAKGEKVFFCDVNSVLTFSDIYDGLHPTATGYNKIGDAFYNAIQTDVLPEPASLGLLGAGAVALLTRRRARTV